MPIETKTRPVAETANLLGCELAADVLRASGKLRLRVTGASMLPVIWSGDVLCVHSFGSEPPVPGEVVLCRREGGLVAHRVVRRVANEQGTQWVLRGDSVAGNDLPVSNDALLGKVVAVERGSRRLVTRMRVAGRVASWFFRQSDFAIRVIRWFLKRGRTAASAILLLTILGSNASAQATNPAYLADFPSVEKVTATMKTADPDESAARQMASFTWLQQMILELAGPRQFQRGGLTPDESKLRQDYNTALYNIQKSNPKYNSIAAMHGLHTSLPFRNELIQKAFPPGFSAEYAQAKAQARQARAQLHQQAVKASEAREAAQRPAEQKALDQFRQQYEAQQREAHMDSQTRQMRRCVTAGRVMAVCVGNGLMGSVMPNVNGMLSAAAPGVVGKEVTGPQMAGVFAGSGWRLEFSEASVALSCGGIIPDSHAYTITFVNNRAVLDIAATPKDVVFSVDGNTLSGSAAQAVDGRVSLGVSRGTDVQGQPVDVYKYQRVTANCSRPVLNATNSPGAVGTQQNLLVGMFNDGDTGPPTPPGLRMNGTYAVPSGFSAQFFPESVILGCGPDVARAYSYTVVADGKQAEIKVNAPDHPLTLLFKPNNQLDAGSGPYLVQGRQITGQDTNGDYTFAPRNAGCNLAVLSPGPVPSTMAPVTASAGNR